MLLLLDFTDVLDIVEVQESGSGVKESDRATAPENDIDGTDPQTALRCEERAHRGWCTVSQTGKSAKIERFAPRDVVVLKLAQERGESGEVVERHDNLIAVGVGPLSPSKGRVARLCASTIT